ncbi:MAG: alpha-L-rhamnosidase, partial [Acidobacteria bacterium]
LAPEHLTGVVIHSDMEVTGSFETSNDMVNQLQHNITWGQKGNFLDVPTDCPQRDERLGWTGDAQAFARTAAFNMNVAGFFTKWLRDLAADQMDDGGVPHVVPNVLGASSRERPAGAAGWGDAAVIVPWTMYLEYGDARFLEEQYDSMARWVEFQRGRAGDDLIWDGDPHFGDWLAFASTDSSYPGATTGKDLIATAFFAHSADLMHAVARVLGKDADAARYRDLFERIKAAFVREFVTETVRVGENTQTAYVLALHFDLLPERMREQAASRLAREVRDRRHLTTGFLGTPYLCHVLTRFGYLDEAYQLLNRREYPSWLYPVTQGATTIWERWDGQKPNGSFQDAGMNSFNHYAYGAIGDWMYEVMGGLGVDSSAPGYKHVVIRPRPGGGFTRVSVAHQSLYGEARSSWANESGLFELAVSIPPNTTATVWLPRVRADAVTEGDQPLAVGRGIASVRQEGDSVVLEIGSGSYRFVHGR